MCRGVCILQRPLGAKLSILHTQTHGTLLLPPLQRSPPVSDAGYSWRVHACSHPASDSGGDKPGGRFLLALTLSLLLCCLEFNENQTCPSLVHCASCLSVINRIQALTYRAETICGAFQLAKCKGFVVLSFTTAMLG